MTLRSTLGAKLVDSRESKQCFATIRTCRLPLAVEWKLALAKVKLVALVFTLANSGWRSPAELSWKLTETERKIWLRASSPFYLATRWLAQSKFTTRTTANGGNSFSADSLSPATVSFNLTSMSNSTTIAIAIAIAIAAGSWAKSC